MIGADRKSPWYRREATRLGVGARLHFAGPVPDVTQIFHGVEAVALPSLFEPFGNVVMEALACGLPVLSSAQSGAAELLPESMQRFVVQDPTNSDEIASKLSALLGADGELQAAARATAEGYTWQRYADKLLAIVSTLTSGRELSAKP